MAAGLIDKLDELRKALEAGVLATSAPTSLVQGTAMQVEDISPIMVNVTYNEKTLKLQKKLSVKPAKGTFIQFLRRLSLRYLGWICPARRCSG
jgi:hypothetical protein